MDVKQDTRSYDWFKFVVAVILALIALWLLLRAQKQAAAPAAVANVPTEAAAAAPQAEIDLPDFPKADFEWNYDADTGLLLDPSGKALYRLDADAGRWLPVIPDGLRAKLPDGFKMAEVDGGWQINGPDGKALFRWNPKTMAWDAVAPEVSLPDFPKADFKWNYDADAGLLLDPSGKALYRLDADTGRWLPVISDDLRAKLPDGFKMAEVDGGWQINGPDGKALFRWNPKTMAWDAVAPEVAVDLPELPKSDFEWNYDADAGLLLDPDGKAVYRLDADTGRWLPVISDDLRAKLPDGFKMAEVDGVWQINGPDGAALYRWNPDLGTWEAIEIAPAVNLPDFPKADFEWNYDADTGLLLGPDGTPRYELDAAIGRWIPVIPDDLRAKLPDGFKLVGADGGWQITGPDGQVLYRWNPETHAWEAVETAVTPSSDCGAQPARLSVGDSAKVLTNLNLRSEPGIGDNWLMTMLAGTVVEVIGGPECVPYGDGAYRWWNVKLPDGKTGWAAEAPIHGDYYFLEPVK